MEDTNISKWAEVEEGGKLARGCPPREAGEVRGTRPTGLRLPLWRHSMGTMVWVVVGPAGSGELWLMAEGPDYPPERGPEATGSPSLPFWGYNLGTSNDGYV